jgi:cell division septum initiation protein DivIVA
MVMELDKILDEMESILSDGWRIPLVNKVIIDENEITMVMDKLRAAVPLEVKRAHDLLEEQKNIIDKSRAEADHIVEQAHAEGGRIVDLAKAEADRLVRQEEVVKAAEEKANGIIATTQQYDRDMRAAADAYAEKLHSESMQYAMDVFNYLEENLTKTLSAVRDNGNALKSSYDADHQLNAGDKGEEEK